MIFDLDGTLIDSIHDLTAAINHGLEAHGLQPIGVEHCKHLVGNGFQNLVRSSLSGYTLAESTVVRITEDIRLYYQNHCLDQTRIYPGVVECLDELASRHIALGILSNKPDALAQTITKELFGAGRFIVVRGERHGTARKPEPQGLLDVCSYIDCAIERSFYVGDSGVDMTTARAAHLVPIGVTWGYRDREDLRQSGAALLIDHPSQLSGCVIAFDA